MDNKNYAVINEIMSCKASSTIILTKSDGEHVGFVADLANNYQRTFWLNISHVNIYSFAMTFAYKLLRDPSKLMKFLQFNQCESDYNKDIIIINAVLEHVATWNYDCLIVIDDLEKLYKDFNISNDNTDINTLMKISEVFDKIYEEMNKEMPLMWFNYGFFSNSKSNKGENK